MPERLPVDTLASGLCALRCPWCGGDIGEATVTLQALHDAHTTAQRGLRWANRAEDGQGDEDALKLDCPACGKPAIAAFQLIRRTPATRVLAVRTAADVAFANGVRWAADT